jgi:hypothetical protein
MNDNLKEMTTLPINLEPVYKINNFIFYSSDKLKEKFIIAFKKSSKGKYVSNEIEKLINKNEIIPCYKSKNLLSFIKYKLSRSTNKYIAAFYVINDKKVIILIDNSTNIFGSSSNNEIASTTMHECIHMIAGKNLSKFIQIFSPKLIKYYTEFFKDYFVITSDIDKKDILKYIKFLIPLEKKGINHINSQLINLFKLLQSFFISKTELKKEEFMKKLSILIIAIKLFVINTQTFLKNINNYKLLFSSLNKAYVNAFNEKNIYTVPIQELITLSEVGSIYAEMKPYDPIIKKLFKIT